MYALSEHTYAQVVIDISTRAFDQAFSYIIPPHLKDAALVGCCVQVNFAGRAALGYIIDITNSVKDFSGSAIDERKLKPINTVLSVSYFDKVAAKLAKWIANTYIAPLNETIKLFTPPGVTLKLVRTNGVWQLAQTGATAVDERWVKLTATGQDYVPKSNAIKQRRIIDALKISQMRVSDLGLEISNVSAALSALEKKSVVEFSTLRRIRGGLNRECVRDDYHQLAGQNMGAESDRDDLTCGQKAALATIIETLKRAGDAPSGNSATTSATPTTPANSTPSAPCFLLDGVTGSGKTEVYLQAIRKVLSLGGSAIVLVPEISLTPQTVARFRARFGSQVAVLHSRLSAGERFDQWELAQSGTARVVVGARSALFAPVKNLMLIIIDEEHESTYKQSSTPRYVARDTAAHLCELSRAVLVMGSATPSMELERAVEIGRCIRLELPERVHGQNLPPITVVNLATQFKSQNKTMFSYPLREALERVISRKEKAILLLNKRGFASFLLCRDCGFVPTCKNCATSFTYHSTPPHLSCHHCNARATVPAVCPECGSYAIKQLGPGTQFAYQQLRAMLGDDVPIIRMDADTTRGKNGHERCLNEFGAASHGVLIGTQMIAKGLDFPDVTLVGVLIADTSLKFPDFRAPERTYQMLEQVAGRAGRAHKPGKVIVQTYWPEHVAIRAAANHDRKLLLDDERQLRQEIGYPPYTRLANILIWGPNLTAVSADALRLAQVIEESLGTTASNTHKTHSSIEVLGPSPCVLSKRQGNHRWHILIKAPANTNLSSLLGPTFRRFKSSTGVLTTIDVDPYDMM